MRAKTNPPHEVIDHHAKRKHEHPAHVIDRGPRLRVIVRGSGTIPYREWRLIPSPASRRGRMSAPCETERDDWRPVPGGGFATRAEVDATGNTILDQALDDRY